MPAKMAGPILLIINVSKDKDLVLLVMYSRQEERDSKHVHRWSPIISRIYYLA